MNTRRERRLLVIRRTVPPATAPLYVALWQSLSAIAKRSGFHAWRFTSPLDAGERLEFLEFEAGADPREDAATREVLQRLEQEVGASRSEEWLEER